MTETLYRKVQRGSRVRYEPVAEHVYWDSLPDGYHLLCVRPGRRSARYNVDPAHADVLAVIADHRETLCDAIRQASELRPVARMSRIEQIAWAEYKRATGAEILQLQRASAQDLIDALQAACIAALKG